MAQTLAEVIVLLKAKLVSLKNGASPVFGDVFDYAQGDFKNFPAASVVETGGRPAQVIDTHRNQRIYNFTIRLYQEQSKQGKSKEQAATIMRAATDSILTAFDQDKDLGGEVQIVRPVEFDTNFQVASGTYNFATFKVDVVVLVNSFK